MLPRQLFNVGLNINQAHLLRSVLGLTNHIHVTQIYDPHRPKPWPDSRIPLPNKNTGLTLAY